MPFVIWLPLLDDVRLRVAPPVCLCLPEARTNDDDRGHSQLCAASSWRHRVNIRY
jgi:hypothetical protein